MWKRWKQQQDQLNVSAEGPGSLIFCSLIFLLQLLPLLLPHSTFSSPSPYHMVSFFVVFFSFSVFLFIPFIPCGGRPHLDPQRRDGATSTRLWGFRTCNLNQMVFFSEVKLSSAPCWTSFALTLLLSSLSWFCCRSLLATPSLRRLPVMCLKPEENFSS